MEEDRDDFNTDKRDDLTSYEKVTYKFVGEPQNITIDGAKYLPVTPTVHLSEDESELTIQTPWINHEYVQPIELEVFGAEFNERYPENSEDNTQFGFRLEVLSQDRGTWIPFEAGPDDTWAWDRLTVKDMGGNAYSISGRAVRYSDESFSLYPKVETKAVELEAFGNHLDFRVGVIPMYSFWSWGIENVLGLDSHLTYQCALESNGQTCQENPE